MNSLSSSHLRKLRIHPAARHPWVVALSLALAGAAAAQVSPAEEAASAAATPPARAKARPPVYVDLSADTPIEAAAQMLASAMGRQIIVDPRVKGNINLNPNGEKKPLALPEAWRRFLAALRGQSFTVVDNAGLLKVVPEAEAKLQAGTVSSGPPTARGDQVLTQIFRLQHESPNNLVAILRPLISANNTINANPGNSTLVITDYADNLQRLAQIIAALDQPAASDVEVIPVRHTLAADLAPLVQKLSDSATTASGAVPGVAPGQAGASTVMVEPRSNSLIVRTSSPARLAVIRSLIDKLDKPTANGGGPAGNIWVVYLKNSDAVKLAEVLRAAMASGSGSGAGGSGSSSASSSALGSARSAPTNPAGGAVGAGASSMSNAPVSASAGPSTGGQIQADPSTNSLIISASEPVYRQMRQVIDQLDTRRVQVRVESIIVKVDASKAAELGVQWQGLLGGRNSNDSTALYSGTNFGSGGNNLLNLSLAAAGSSSSTTTTVPGTGLNVGLLQKVAGKWTLGALAHFLESNAGGNVLSTPEIVALDNEEAKIVVGQNVPFITGSFTSTGAATGTTNPFQTIERKDVGLTLRIKSQVGEGGTVRMNIYQENSSVNTNTTSGLITDKSSIETTVLVDDGATLVLGGLMKDEYSDSETGVPWLSQLPWIGNLFKSTSRSHTKSNLMVFLRPTVLRDQGAADRITLDRYDAIRALQAPPPAEGRAPALSDGGKQPSGSTSDQPLLPALPGKAGDAAAPKPAAQ